MAVPIVEHLKPQPTPRLQKAVERLAEDLLRELPILTPAERIRPLIATELSDSPTLHLDDLSEITRLDSGDDIRFYQDRARLRAGDGDLVATCGDPIKAYEPYCRDFLGLGSPRWLRPRPLRNPLRIAEACWGDTQVRKSLIAQAARGDLAYIHPHMGTFPVWELAALLHEETGRGCKVIAPHPGLTRWVNNKVAFAETVSRLFGPEFVPRTESAWNPAILAKRVKLLADRAEGIGLKLPDAGGGAGNVVFPSSQLRGRSLSELEQTMKQALSLLGWRGDSVLLVDVWEADVLCSPSVQLWIPPERDGLPVVEGIFVQFMEGAEGGFVGATPAELPKGLSQMLADHCWLLAKLLQRLGYVGRCSFDLILTGKDWTRCGMEFIECNGRWGGTSLPMTLMNRIFGDWSRQPFAVQIFHHIQGLQNVTFGELLEIFDGELYDTRTKEGSLILYNPGRLRYQSGISTLVLGSSRDKTAEVARQRFAARLLELACARS